MGVLLQIGIHAEYRQSPQFYWSNGPSFTLRKAEFGFFFRVVMHLLYIHHDVAGRHVKALDLLLALIISLPFLTNYLYCRHFNCIFGRQGSHSHLKRKLIIIFFLSSLSIPLAAWPE